MKSISKSPSLLYSIPGCVFLSLFLFPAIFAEDAVIPPPVETGWAHETTTSGVLMDSDSLWITKLSPDSIELSWMDAEPTVFSIHRSDDPSDLLLIDVTLELTYGDTPPGSSPIWYYRVYELENGVGEPLLETNWGQRNEFARFSPRNLRLGCWSTAIAQILYYHRLAPHGSVQYECSDSTPIDEDFDLHTFDWDLFVNRIDAGTPEESIDEVALYCYYASVTVQKDFGTGTYVLSHAGRALAVSDHYDCTATMYPSSHPLDQTRQLIRDELNAGRPVMMHMRDLAHVSYHAVAVDGYLTIEDQLWIHINMGWEGSSDGWYDFDEEILDYDDNGYRKIMTIVPF